jgi:hypothetical protein
MEGEASYYLGLAHLSAGDHETALTVSGSKLSFFCILLQEQKKCILSIVSVPIYRD